jgi:hypothetical protein
VSIFHDTTGHNIDFTKFRFYMAARMDKIIILELAAKDPIEPYPNGAFL